MIRFNFIYEGSSPIEKLQNIIINYHETYTVDYEGNSEARITPASQYVMGVLLTMLKSIYRLSYYIILNVNQYNKMQRHRGHTCTFYGHSRDHYTLESDESPGDESTSRPIKSKYIALDEGASSKRVTIVVKLLQQCHLLDSS